MQQLSTCSQPNSATKLEHPSKSGQSKAVQKRNALQPALGKGHSAEEELEERAECTDECLIEEAQSDCAVGVPE